MIRKVFDSVLLSLIILSFVMFGSCQKSKNEFPVGKTVEVTSPPQFQRTTGQIVSSDPDNVPLPRVLVSLQPEDYVIQVLDTNLDIDQLDEQIIAFKKRNDPDDQIYILVIDFDTVRNTYMPVWMGKTLATHNRTFTLYTADILGDHVPEIICLGRNNKGEQTLDIFRKILPPQGLGLYYTSIFSLTTNGYIEIQEQPRSEAYRLLQRNDPSFPIMLYTRDPESSNFMDLIRYTYLWNIQEQKYVQTGIEKVPGQIQAEKQLAELFAKDAEGVEEFLSGPWYRVETTKKTEPFQQEMLYFDPQNRRIVFYNRDAQEILVWRSSYRTIYRGLFINAHNEAIPSMQKQIALSILGMDTLEVQVRSMDDNWSSVYKKLSKELQRVHTSSNQISSTLSPFHIEGSYSNDQGIELTFHSHTFILKEKENTFEGVYVLYSLPEYTILELKALKPNGLVEFVRSYGVSLEEEKKETQKVRILTLTPVSV
ncbi:MAG: pallilysin-related adhesin, partial [Spirochaetales bacterium]